ncbi:hypothetical protein [Streptomyces sp. WP-1]|uniref:hypothetical protein n=1 Tax=Streptomyces sp. WP-1 TaxID=3041497 RepID=UPI002649DF95|nr:hypothetical protein [Streptomyces sp. WP-1]WKE68215.1 hypothetical protein QHG49_03845 [Streptomyces sp. WP-1]
MIHMEEDIDTLTRLLSAFRDRGIRAATGVVLTPPLTRLGAAATAARNTGDVRR